MLGDAFERSGGGDPVAVFVHPPRDPVLTFLERYVDNPGLLLTSDAEETVAALIEARTRELGETGGPADTPMNQRSVLFNDLSAAPYDGHVLLSTRIAMTDHLHAMGWRRRLSAADVNG